MADAGYLTIGKVVKRLQAEYPDLSVYKVRYLEDEGYRVSLFHRDLPRAQRG